MRLYQCAFRFLYIYKAVQVTSMMSSFLLDRTALDMHPMEYRLSMLLRIRDTPAKIIRAEAPSKGSSIRKKANTVLRMPRSMESHQLLRPSRRISTET